VDFLKITSTLERGRYTDKAGLEEAGPEAQSEKEVDTDIEGNLHTGNEKALAWPTLMISQL